MSKKKSSWKHKLAAVLVSCFIIVIVLLLGEVFCRLFFTRITFLESSRYLFTPHRFGASFGNTPNLEGLSFSEKFNTDENGFRYDPEFKSTAPKDAPAILIIGDSVSFGPGVKETETIAGRLRRALPNEQIYNASVLGYDTFDYKNVVTSVIKQKPEIKTVLLFYCLNDLSDVSAQLIRQQSETFENPDALRERPNIARRINEYLRTRSKLYLWLRSMLYDSSRTYFLNDFLFYKQDDAELQPGLQPLADLNETLAASGIKLKVFLMPYETQLRPGSPPEYFTPQEKVAKFLKQNNIDYYDAIADFKKTDSPALLFIFGDPMHLSAEGHRLAAQTVCKELEEKCAIQ
jgi:lysophospholipase L1-like esterase